MATSLHESIALTRNRLSRRRFLHHVSAAGVATGMLGFRDMISLQAEELRRQGKSMILLWMAGGPSQMETFDPKPKHANGGETRVISTSIPGVQISEHWPSMAKMMNEVSLIRSMTNKEGNHQRATYQMHTGYIPSGSVKHPGIGSCIAQQLADPETDLPSVVSIGQTQGAGFLGVDYEPFNVNSPGEMPLNLATSKTDQRFSRRLGLLGKLDGEFAARGAQAEVRSHQQLYNKASKLVLSPRTETFDLSKESEELTRAYGDSDFGRSCLLARRLVESGVTFVEIRSNGWDTHQDNFTAVANKANEVDPAAATLLQDLKDRGMLDDTLVVWTGEFGRSPRVNARGGRDHFPVAFNSWMAGSGVKRGQVIGSTSKDGTSIEDRPVPVADFLQSVCHSLNVDADHENISPLGRPMKVVDGGELVDELFT
ncbi:DUF1501 domain-containing protein [Thalassoglobus polymorphus]|uniref:DUF1501 domain-containing protein n=1 Tax=Thalassoglobus polymorphus TaxID=2527994 RepID=A0A517QUM7_9PLAN|nr:DUF1501 domain-containing protein [Thalassoglobus polymorphus]QDT35325.1 hypothetical protein Mal48_46010 [Thalassoglobus polymorphus]